jgi:hypothetical protein
MSSSGTVRETMSRGSGGGPSWTIATLLPLVLGISGWNTGIATLDPEPIALAVSVTETRSAVLLHIPASGGVEPGSVEVRFAGRKTVVLARDVAGRPLRSRLLRLPELVREEGPSADYDADGTLVMTLRKQTAAKDPGSADNVARLSAPARTAGRAARIRS